MVKCTKCGKTCEYTDGYYICDNCKIMDFSYSDYTAMQSFTAVKIKEIVELGKKYESEIHDLRQKQIENRKTLSAEDEIKLELIDRYINLKPYFQVEKGFLSERGICEKLYEFNKTVIALKTLYP